jgi:hypothetical protein
MVAAARGGQMQEHQMTCSSHRISTTLSGTPSNHKINGIAASSFEYHVAIPTSEAQQSSLRLLSLSAAQICSGKLFRRSRKKKLCLQCNEAVCGARMIS